MIPTEHFGKPFKELKPAYLDFEYNKSSEMKFNLVCMSILHDGELKRFWLHNKPQEWIRLKNYLLEMREDYIFVAFNVVAEASCFISLGLDSTKFAWIDLMIEYKMLLNHWNEYRYGKQLMDGKEKKTTPPPRNKWSMTEGEKAKMDFSKPKSNLAAACYKMLGVVIDFEHKDEMRDLIISAPEEFSQEEIKDIQYYCDSDVDNLPTLKDEIFKAYRRSTAKKHIYFSEIAWRGNAAARVSLITQLGYPVHPVKVKNFSKSVKLIINDIAEDINKQFPDRGFFEWKKADGRYSKKMKPQRDWIDTTEHKDNWMQTDGGKHSLSLDAYARHYSFRHDYPRDNIPAQMLRFLKTQQSLNGFMPSNGKRKSFFDSYGTDGRARAWLNPYGSQSSRYQPAATGYIPLKSAWMRALIEPKPGKAIVGIDYGSEEFLLAALLSKDKNMYEAYASGDPYFYFAKLAKAVPMDAKREDNEPIRNLFKSTVLGVGFLMQAPSLSKKLTHDTGRDVSESEAQDLIDSYFTVFSEYAEYIDRTNYEYSRRGFLKLADGWIMFGDNDNHRSVSNCPVQGMGGVVLRKAIQLGQQKKSKIILPLHDALYAEFIATNLASVDCLWESMKEAFCHYFQEDEEVYEWSKAIRLDIDVWGPTIEEGEGITPEGRKFKGQKIYIDKRSASEYERFRKYF